MSGADAAHTHGHEHAHEGEHGHDHHHHHHKNAGKQALMVAFVANAAFLVVEAGVGWWTSSLALISDAVHMLTDVLALGVALVAASMRDRPRTPTATFGNTRVSVLGALLNGSLAIGASIWIVVEAVERLAVPVQVLGSPVVATAVVGLGVNLVSAWWLHRSGDHGVNMRGALLHMLGDALGSVAAIVAGVVIVAGGPVEVDAIASVVVGAIIVGSAVPLLRDVVSILLERAPRGVDPVAVKATICADPSVSDVIGLHIWGLDDGDVVATVVAVTAEDSVAAAAAAAARIKAGLKDTHRIAHVTIEWQLTTKPEPCC